MVFVSPTKTKKKTSDKKRRQGDFFTRFFLLVFFLLGFFTRFFIRFFYSFYQSGFVTQCLFDILLVHQSGFVTQFYPIFYTQSLVFFFVRLFFFVLFFCSVFYSVCLMFGPFFFFFFSLPKINKEKRKKERKKIQTGKVQSCVLQRLRKHLVNDAQTPFQVLPSLKHFGSQPFSFVVFGLCFCCCCFFHGVF